MASYSFGNLTHSGSSSLSYCWVGWYSFGSGNITSVANQSLSLTGRYKINSLSYAGYSNNGAKYRYYCIRITDSAATSYNSYTNSYAYKKVAPSINGNTATIKFDLNATLPAGSYKVWIWSETNSTYGNTYAMIGGSSGNPLRKTAEDIVLAVPSFYVKTSDSSVGLVQQMFVKTAEGTWSEIQQAYTKTADSTWSEVTG